MNKCKILFSLQFQHDTRKNEKETSDKEKLELWISRSQCFYSTLSELFCNMKEV